MLEGGIDTDIRTNLPLAMEHQAKADKATMGFRNATLKAMDLAAELQKGSPVMAILARQYSQRLDHLAQNDPECQGIEKLIQAIRTDLEIRPRLAEERMLHIVGPQLANFIEEGPAAPTGDTGQE